MIMQVWIMMKSGSISKYSEKIKREYSEQRKNRLRKEEIINYDNGNKEPKSKLEITEEYSEEQDNSDFNDSDSTEPYDKEESIEFILSQELEDESFDSPTQYEGFEDDPD